MNPLIERLLLVLLLWGIVLFVYIKLNNSPRFVRWLSKLSYKSEDEILAKEAAEKEKQEKEREEALRKKEEKK